MKKFLNILLVLVLAFCMTCPPAMASAETDDVQAQDTQIAKRTVLLYLCGTDLETNYGSATYNLRQVLRSYFSSGDDIKFIVMTGGTDDWTLESEYLVFPDDVVVPDDAIYLMDEEEYAEDPRSEISNVYNQIWEAKGLDAEDPNERGKMILLDGDGIFGEWNSEDGGTAKRSMISLDDYVLDEDDWEVFDTDKIDNYEWMNDPEVLKAFINFGVENYPAEKYDLILWDHGSGPEGFCNNQQEYLEATDTMNVPEIMDALLNNNYVDPNGDGVVDNKFEIVDFDACLMGSVEVVFSLADFCDYFIGSPEPEPNYGQDYEGWLNMVGAKPEVDGYTLCKKIVDDFIEFYDKETGDGSDEEATLAAFDTGKLLNAEFNGTNFVDALTAFNRTLNEEIMGTKYYDEFRAFRDCLKYGFYSYYDIGVLASQLAYLYDDVDLDDLTPEGEINTESSYKDSATVIQNILNDEEIIYAKGTENFLTEPHYYRDADGTIKYGRQGTSGLYLTFDSSANPRDPYEHYYPDMKVAANMIEELHKGENDPRPEFLREFIDTGWKLGLAQCTGSTVSQMLAEGVDKDDITYETIKEHWQTVPSGTLGYIMWDLLCEDYVELIGGDEAAKAVIEGWIPMMVNESISEDNIEVQPLKKKDTEAGVITFNNIKKQAIDSVQANIFVEFPVVKEFVNDPANQDYIGDYKDISPIVKIGSFTGSEIMDIDPEAEGYEAAINWLSEPTSKWELDLPELKWYAIRDAEGKLHVAAAEERLSFLEVNAGYWTKELREEYDEDTDTFKTKLKDVYHGINLLFSKNDQGEWYLSHLVTNNDYGMSRFSRVKEFTGKHTLYTTVYLDKDFDFKYVPATASSFEISPETIDKISLEYVDLSEIPDVGDTDGDGIAVYSTVTARNIYGYSLDITDKVKKATGSEITHIEYARIRPGVLTEGTEGELVPEVVYLGETLENGVDYALKKVNASDKFDKVGSYEVQLTGKGRFTGKANMIFNIVMPEDEAAQAVEDAREAVAAAQKDVDALAEDASAEDIQAAYDRLVKAQNALTDALDTLQRTKDIISAEEQAKLNDEIEKLEQDVSDLTDQLAEAQVIDISNFAVTLEKTSYPYTGKAIKPVVKKVSGLKATDYTVSYSNNIKSGTGKVIIKAKGDKYKGQITKTFKITKRANTLSVKAKTTKIKYTTLKKKTKTYKASEVITFKSKGQGKRTYKRVSGNSKITINKTTGKVTVKKGLKKGTYKVKVKVKAAGNSTYKESKWKAVTFTIKVV